MAQIPIPLNGIFDDSETANVAIPLGAIWNAEAAWKIKNWNGIAWDQIKTWNGVAVANVKKIDGIDAK